MAADYTDFPDLSFTDKSAEIHLDAIRPVSANPGKREGQSGQHHKPPARDEARDHFEELSKAAERAHAILIKAGSPYRFCVYRKDGGVFVDIVRLGSDGRIVESKVREITHDEFQRWIKHIEEREGMMLDETA